MAAMATMVNMNNLLNGKDSRWLQLEVCREFQRNKCSRPDTECKFAHPPATVEVQNGRVTACYDSIKGRCNREKPPCKYFHPPQHLKDQLLINGRNHLALKNALMQQMGLTPGQVLPGQVPAVVSHPSYAPSYYYRSFERSDLHTNVGGVGGAGAAASHLAALDPISLALLAPQATSPYLSGVPGVGSTYAQYYAPQLVPAVLGHDPAAAAASPLGVMQQPVLQQKLPRTDRLELLDTLPVCQDFNRQGCTRPTCRFVHIREGCGLQVVGCRVVVCRDAAAGTCRRAACRYYHIPVQLPPALRPP
ncbi:protein muscleblind isoform X2 [Spodoptera litura]|uniref:Protein muscleblind isoform X2 n=1 Tax=Spodoptera litura TaxID=69820 RepID=A0A9J7IN16_SPOLT|nr:protein muscleblind isoform X2 [Spodoptera litura]